MQFSATIVAIQQRTPKVKTFLLDYGTEKFDFYPGQWVDIHLTIDDETHNCGYSITSIPSSHHTVEIAVKLAPDLALTAYLHQNSKVGDKLYTSLAQGDVYLDNNISGAYVFIAGGVGITPLFSMIKHVLARKPNTPVKLIYSIATTKEFLFQSELEKLAQQHENFQCLATITREQPPEKFRHGRITKNYLESIDLPNGANYYLCGPPAMVDSIAHILEDLKDKLSITMGNIHYDKWWS